MFIMEKSLGRRWLAALLWMPAACGGVEVGPSYDDAWTVARPYCSEPLVSLPATIDSDVRTIRFSGRREAEVVAYLFSNPGYNSVELGPSRLLPDGLGLIRYTIAGSSRMVNHRHTCPDGAADLGLHPSVPRASDGPRACVTVKAGASPIARWAIHRT